jgi:hypothetical protein
MPRGLPRGGFTDFAPTSLRLQADGIKVAAVIFPPLAEIFADRLDKASNSLILWDILYNIKQLV